MEMADFSDAFLYAVEIVLEHEGGLSMDPHDRGRLTNWGISERSYPDLDIANLTRWDAIDIYHRDYWMPGRYDEIRDRRVAAKVFDMAVNMSHRRAHELLQRALRLVGQTHVVVDGIIGPQTIGAANAADPDDLLRALRLEAACYYVQLARADWTQEKFLRGWLWRAVS